VEERAFRKYKGYGTLTYPEGGEVQCTFTATQREDGDVELFCTTETPGIPAAWFRGAFGGDTPEPEGFRGVSDEGAPVEATRRLVNASSTFRSNAQSEIVYKLVGQDDGSPVGLDVGDAQSAQPGSEFRFTVANLLFLGISESGTTTTLELDGVPVKLQRLPDYEERSKAVKRDGVTATSEIRIPAQVGLQAAIELAGDVCELCSLARGTVIGWICCDLVTATGEQRYSHHIPALLYPYAGGLPLIDPRFPRELKEFLETGLAPYRELRGTYEFRTVVHASCMVRGHGFLDTRALTCVSLLEHILLKDAELHGGVTVLPEGLFKERLPKLMAGVKALLQLGFPDAVNEQIAQITGHVQGFNWSSPRQRLRRMAKRIGIAHTELSSAEIDRILDTRNSLVHRLKFFTEDRVGEYLRLVWILDRLGSC
jgi:hypothetical protein